MARLSTGPALWVLLYEETDALTCLGESGFRCCEQGAPETQSPYRMGHPRRRVSFWACCILYLDPFFRKIKTLSLAKVLVDDPMGEEALFRLWSYFDAEITLHRVGLPVSLQEG